MSFSQLRHSSSSLRSLFLRSHLCAAGRSFSTLPAWTSALKDPSLVKQASFINNQWVADASSHIDVHDPATGEKLGHIPALGETETSLAVEAAHKAFHEWSTSTATQRAAILTKWFELMQQHKADLAYIMTREQGKPLAEATGEIDYAAGFFTVFAEQCKRVFGEVLQAPNKDTRIITFKQPVGVVGAITPWNFPAAMITIKVGAAIAAGCTSVLKPSELTPYSALALAELGVRAGLPAGVFNVITGHAKNIGSVLTSDPRVKKITFTGSTPIGKLLYKQSADTVKRLSMELGGNAPFLIFDDADLSKAVDGCIANKFRNAGQTCVTANRIFVQRNVYEKFSDLLAKKVGALKVGNGLQAGVTIGPLISSAAVEKVHRQVLDATSKGGVVLVGGKKLPELGSNFFYAPTVIAYAKKDMTCFEEETFGPVAFLFPFDTEEEVIQLANDTNVGLAAYTYTNDSNRQWRLMERLQYGMVGVNNFTVSSPYAPFGGIKESGFGREGSHLGLEDYLSVKTCHIAINSKL